MPGLIHSEGYKRSRQKVCDQAPRLDELIEAVEWELLCADDVDNDDYMLVSDGAKGRVRCYPISTIPPGIVVVFGFEDHGGERKVVLIDVFVSAVEGDDGDDDDDE